MSKLVNLFAVGCDPEFVILDKSGRIVNVSALGHLGPCGWDHNGLCAEIRPLQAHGTFTLVKRIREILLRYPKLEAFRQRTDDRWRGGAYVNDGVSTVSLGGHVHFGLGPDKLPTDALKALDRLTMLLEKLDVIPQAECVARRSKSGYGKFSDIRSDAPDGHVEYRTMASWMHNPWIAFLALTLAKLAVVSPDTFGALVVKNASRSDIERLLEPFRHKDLNVLRLLNKLDRSTAWLNTPLDTDIKEAWAKPL